MIKPAALAHIQSMAPYAPGLSIAEIQEKYGVAEVIKLASNENPLGASPLAQEAARRCSSGIFRYPQGGNPRLVKALAKKHAVAPEKIVVGNGSDEVIDLLIRILARPAEDNIACFRPCFSIYPIQAGICGVETRRTPVEADFSFNFDSLLNLVDQNSKLVFITTPDNPSGYCPPAEAVREFARKLAAKAPQALLVIDEAYMDFAPDEAKSSLLASGNLPANAAFLRTFSKSYGLAGLRLGYGVLPANIADAWWRARLPFSINIIAEEAALAALEDEVFRQATLETVAQGREQLRAGLAALGCQVWPSSANFVLTRLPAGSLPARECFEKLLVRGIIIRPLNSYGLPDHLRVSIGTKRENAAFLSALADVLAENIGENNV